jgi:hypothetical protein
MRCMAALVGIFLFVDNFIVLDVWFTSRVSLGIERSGFEENGYLVS